MKKILIITLGKGIYDKDNKIYIYRETEYSINGKRYSTRYVAQPLIEEYEPDEVIVLGTISSAWYNFLAAFNENIAEVKDYLYKLESNEFRFAKEEELKANEIRINDIFAKYFLHCPIKIVFLKYGMNEEELKYNFTKISDTLQEKTADVETDIAFDITHSFRSLPIYNLSVMNYLRICSVNGLNVSHIFYGMLEVAHENNGVAPIIDMKNVFDVMDLAAGAQEFSNTGNAISLMNCISDDSELKEALRKFDISCQLNDFNRIDASVMDLLQIVECEKTNSSYVSLRKMVKNVLKNKLLQISECDDLLQYYSSLSVIDKRTAIVNWCISQNRLGLAVANCQELLISIFTIIYYKEIGRDFDVDVHMNEKARKKAEDFFVTKVNGIREELDSKEIVLLKSLVKDIERYKPIRNVFAHNLLKSESTLEKITEEEAYDFLNDVKKLKFYVDNQKTRDIATVLLDKHNYLCSKCLYINLRTNKINPKSINKDIASEYYILPECAREYLANTQIACISKAKFISEYIGNLKDVSTWFFLVELKELDEVGWIRGFCETIKGCNKNAFKFIGVGKEKRETIYDVGDLNVPYEKISFNTSLICLTPERFDFNTIQKKGSQQLEKVRQSQTQKKAKFTRYKSVFTVTKVVSKKGGKFSLRGELPRGKMATIPQNSLSQIENPKELLDRRINVTVTGYNQDQNIYQCVPNESLSE